MIKYSIAHKICESNLEWNSDKRQNREIIKICWNWLFWVFH
jgi:hypothetical protein